MFRKRIVLVTMVVILCLVLIAGGIAIASDITTATYVGTIRVTNNSTATANVSTVMALSSADLISQVWVDSDFTRVAIRSAAGADVPFMPSINSTIPWSLWVPSIGDTATIDYLFYTGPSDLVSTKYYFPASAGMTVADAPSLELSDNFTLAVSGYLNTDSGKNKNIIYKPNGGLRLAVSENVSGNITVGLSPSGGYTDAFQADSWTDVGDKIQVTTASSRLDYDALRGDGDDRSYYDLTPVSDAAWTLDFTWNPTSAPVNDGNVFVFGLWSAASNYDGYAGDAIFLSQLSTNLVRIGRFDGGISAFSGNITIVHGTTYYVTLTRDSATSATLNVYSDDLRTTHIAGSPVNLVIPATITGLRYVQGSNFAGVGLTGREIGWIDSLFFYPEAQWNSILATASSITSGEYDLTVSEQPVLNFDGNDYARRAIANFATSNSTGTIAAWFKTSSATAQTLFASADEAAGSGSFSFGVRSTGTLIINNNFSDNDAIGGSTNVANGRWHLGVVTSNGTAWNLFTDDATNETETVIVGSNSGTWFNHAFAQNRDNITIGVLNNNAPLVNYASANISEVLVYDTVLTPAQISAIYYGNAPTTNLIARWRLSEGSGSTLYDSVGTNHMTITGATWGNYKLSLNIDDDTLITADGAAVPDNANGYDFFLNDVMPYVESATVTVDGVLVGSWAWEYAETFTDASGNGNTATPNFRTTTEDSDVTASLVSYAPISQARAPAYSVGDAPDFITANITTSSNFTSGAVTPGSRPGEQLIEDVAASSGTPNIWIWGILGGMTIALASLFISYMERQHGGGGGTLILRLAVAITVFGVLIAIDKFDFWMLIMYLFIALAPAMASRQLDWGGAVGELNLIGFLAMTWVGLTTINRIQEGQLVTSAETAHLNTLMFTQEFTLLDVFHLPIINFEFFTRGIPGLLKWDYAFFGGNAQLIQYMLYSLTAIVSFIVLGFIIGTVTNYFARTT